MKGLPPSIFIGFFYGWGYRFLGVNNGFFHHASGRVSSLFLEVLFPVCIGGAYRESIFTADESQDGFFFKKYFVHYPPRATLITFVFPAAHIEEVRVSLQEVIEMGWFEFLIVTVLILTVIAAILSWQMRSFGYAIIFGLLFCAAVIAMMNGPLGDQIRKEMQEDKAAASQVKRTG